MSPAWAVMVLVLGLVLRMRTTVVVLLAAAVASLGSGQSPLELLGVLGKAFVETRHLTLFLLTLPAVGTAERYGLRRRVAEWIERKAGNLSPAGLLSGFQFFRVVCGVLGVRLNGHPTLVRPLVTPMASARARLVSEEKVKAASAAAENYGNFYGQNLSLVGAGLLMAAACLQRLGHSVDPLRMVFFAVIPAGVSLFCGWLQFRRIPPR